MATFSGTSRAALVQGLIGSGAGVFTTFFEALKTRWLERPDQRRFPTGKNWRFEVMPTYTVQEGVRLEKQLQKMIAIHASPGIWANDIPTASGLFDSGGRQKNIDLCERIPEGFRFIELKLESDTPEDAACQLLDYVAHYFLYRLTPELSALFPRNELLHSARIDLEVLAPASYFATARCDLEGLAAAINRELSNFVSRYGLAIETHFRWSAFPADFIFRHNIAGTSIHTALHGRTSPIPKMAFSKPGTPNVSSRFAVAGHGGQAMHSLADWAAHGLPESRRGLHWKEGRSAFELARAWTRRDVADVPEEVSQLLESHTDLRDVRIVSGITEHETPLRFGSRGPRSHDLMLRGMRGDEPIVICVEAKADEPFDLCLADRLKAAWKQPTTQFPERLEWLVQMIMGRALFTDQARREIDPELAALYYQLFSAVGGTVVEAGLQGAGAAVLLVHEFQTSSKLAAKMDANTAAFDQFLRMLLDANRFRGETAHSQAGFMIGPIVLMGHARGTPVQLYIGKLRTVVD